MGILSFLFLTCMNFFIYWKMKEKRSHNVNKNKLSFYAVRLNSLCANEVARKKSIVSYEVKIVLVYVILNMPRLILNLAEYFIFSTIHDTKCQCDKTLLWVSVLARISHMFLAINRTHSSDTGAGDLQNQIQSLVLHVQNRRR